MKTHQGFFLVFLLACALLAACSADVPKAPFNYLWGTAYHILPETHTDESGYFSICEGLDGKVYVGTAAYNRNAYLVEFDPITGRQRIVIDTNKVCGLTAAGYAAQAKIHTKNFVGPSGKIYVGSKQGYRSKGDTSEYPGGYVMTYEPRTMTAENLGMPYPTEGVIDVVADEARGLLYVVTCEHQHWMLYSMKDKQYRELGPMLAPYATTLLDAKGRAHVITKDFQLATYDPKTDKVQVRPIFLGKERWQSKTQLAIPIWSRTKDKRTAYLILLDDPTLLRFDLMSGGKEIKPANLGKMIEGKGPDSRSGLAIAPDGRIYALVSVRNETGFGAGSLHHLVRYDPKAKKHEDLGVPALKNPDFFAWKGADGKPLPWSHGYNALPDGTQTPLYNQGLVVTADNTLYATFLYPFTLFRIDAFKTLSAAQTPPAVKTPVIGKSPALGYSDFALAQCDKVERDMPNIIDVAEKVAERHLSGGLIDYAWNDMSLQQDLIGRSGGMMTITRPWKEDRTEEEKANDVILVSWDRAPKSDQAAWLQEQKKRGAYIVGFGPKDLPALAESVKQCDAFFDTGLPDDRVVVLPNGERAGHANHLVNPLYGWAFIAEVVAACTRHGRMPTIWKSYSYPDGKAWGQQYDHKLQFHDEYTVPPVKRGVLGREFLRQMRLHIRRFERTQLPAVTRAADLIAQELTDGRKTWVIGFGHMPYYYLGYYEDVRWSDSVMFHSNVADQVADLKNKVPEGALAVRLGYFGEDSLSKELFKQKKLRMIFISANNPYPEMQLPGDALVKIDMGMAFGDACVPIKGYPLKICPPSGIMQIIAYEAIDTEVLARVVGGQTPTVMPDRK